MKNTEQKKTILKLLLSVLIIGAILAVGYLVLYLLGWTDISREELQAYIASKGAVAPLVFIFISFIQVTFVPIPGAITILAGNYLFGTIKSFLYSYIGSMIGTMVAFLLGKWLGRPFVNWVSGGADKTEKWLKKLKGRENILLFFMFLLPFFPDDILCSVAGILPISWAGFIAMQIFTRATSIGGTLLFLSGEFIPFSGWGLVVLILLMLAGIAVLALCLFKADKINAYFSALADKLFPQKQKKAKPADGEEEKRRASDG